MLFFLILAKLDHIPTLIDCLDGKTKRLQFFDKDAEGRRDARFFDRFAFDDRFIGIDATLDIIRFDSEHFLKGVRGAISLERPHFHLTEALTTELSLTTKRLLCDQTIWSRGTCMDLVFHKMVKFQHGHHTNGYWLIIRHASLAITQGLLAKDRH